MSVWDGKMPGNYVEGCKEKHTQGNGEAENETKSFVGRRPCCELLGETWPSPQPRGLKITTARQGDADTPHRPLGSMAEVTGTAGAIPVYPPSAVNARSCRGN